MTDNDMLLRLLAENFSLKDQLATALKEQQKSEDSSLFWYRKYTELAEKTGTKEEVEDIPLSMEGLKNECDMTKAGADEK